MNARSSFWPSAVAAFLGGYGGIALLTAALFLNGQFECGVHESGADRIPPLFGYASTALIAIVAARAFKGSALWALVLAAPIYVITFIIVVVFALSPDQCRVWSIPLLP